MNAWGTRAGGWRKQGGLWFFSGAGSDFDHAGLGRKLGSSAWQGPNARMSHAQVRAHVPLDAALGEMLQQAMEQLSLSARAYDRILKVARTIADLAGSDRVEQPHLLGAIQYRSLDRNLFY